MAQFVERDRLGERFDVVRLLGPWSHYGQVVTKDVPHLRELIDVKMAEHPTDLAKPRVIFCGPVR